MKIAFLEPPPEKGRNPVDRVYGCNYRTYPKPNIFALSQATLLKEKGYEVAILDFTLDRNGRDEFLRTIKNKSYDIYVFFSVFLSEKLDISVGKEIRKYDKDAFIIYNGTAPSWEPENYIFDNRVFVVRGEPELTLLELVNALETGKDLQPILGINYLDKGQIKENPSRGIIDDLDSLPIPDRRLLPEKYFDPRLGGKSTIILTSRRCNFRCYYCVGNALSLATKIDYRKYFGKNPPPRIRSVDNVVKEFEDIAELGYKSVDIADDRFIWGKRRTIEICERISHLNLNLFIRERADLWDDDIARALRKAGANHVALGVESFNQKVLDFCRKDLKVEDIYKSIEILKKHGFKIELNMLLGSTPIESKADLEKSLEKAKKLRPDYLLLNICTPFPGTDFYEMCKKNGWIVDDVRESDPQWKAIISYPHLRKEELESIIIKNWRYYFTPRYIFRQLVNSSPSELVDKAKTAFQFLKLYFKYFKNVRSFKK